MTLIINPTLFFLWYTSGLLIFLISCKLKNSEVVVENLLSGMIYSFGGPLTGLLSVFELSEDKRFVRLRKFLSKRIF